MSTAPRRFSMTHITQAMSFASKYFVNEYFGDIETVRHLRVEVANDSGELGTRVSTAIGKKCDATDTCR